MPLDLWVHERQAIARGFRRVAGIDEAGRGPLAGPVVAAAVVLPETFQVMGVRDSKKLTPARRARLYNDIYDHAVGVGLGIVDAVEIDRINILRASLMAMAMAVRNLAPAPDFLLVDGKFPVPADFPQQPLIGGDNASISIAAASIVAKVTRDRMMAVYAGQYPEFGFSAHQGYPTRSHREAIRQYGCSPIHRRTFKGVREYCHQGR